MRILVFFLAAISFVRCCENINCVNGFCEKSNELYSCHCYSQWSGTNCTESWFDDSTYRDLFWFYTAYTLILQSICFSFSSYQLYLIFRYSALTFNSLPGYILSLFNLGSLIRVIYYAIDPHGVRGIFDTIVTLIGYDLPYIFWIIGSFMLYLYWIEIQTTLRVRRGVCVDKYKPYLIGIIMLASVMILGSDVWSLYSQLGMIVFNLFFAILAVVLICIISISGINLIRTVSKAYLHNRMKEQHKFVKKLGNYMLIMNTFLIFTFLTLIVYQFINASRRPMTWIAFLIVYRTEEFGVVFSTLYFIARKKPHKTYVMPTSQMNTEMNSATGADSTVDNAVNT